MATTSSRSFANNSGLDQQQALQTRQSATDLQSDPAAVRALQDVSPSQLGISQRPAQASGRSFYDPARQAERWVRGTGSKEQTAAAAAAQGFNEAANPVESARRRAFGPRGQGMAGMSAPSPQFGEAQGMAQPPPQAPSIFNQSMTNPAMAQSQYSIGSALGGVPRMPSMPRMPKAPPFLQSQQTFL